MNETAELAHQSGRMQESCNLYRTDVGVPREVLFPCIDTFGPALVSNAVLGSMTRYQPVRR